MVTVCCRQLLEGKKKGSTNQTLHVVPMAIAIYGSYGDQHIKNIHLKLPSVFSGKASTTNSETHNNLLIRTMAT